MNSIHIVRGGGGGGGGERISLITGSKCFLVLLSSTFESTIDTKVFNVKLSF